VFFLDSNLPLCCHVLSGCRPLGKRGVRIAHGKKEGGQEGQEGKEEVISGCVSANGTGCPVPLAFEGTPGQ
jgi:hypothetical protein